MAYDRTLIWRDVGHRWRLLSDKAPFEGMVPVVEIYLFGREEPVIASLVETRKDPEYSWLALYTGDDTQNYIWVEERNVARVELTFPPKDTADAKKFELGFRSQVVPDQSPRTTRAPRGASHRIWARAGEAVARSA